MSVPATARDGFRHQALMYASDAEFLNATVSFIRDGVRAGEPVLVVESLERIDLLRSALGAEAEAVQFADMADAGHNPARIIPIWQDFVDRNAGAPGLRGIGEPIWAGRTADEMIECQRHEALLNSAFERGRPFVLLCPYNVEELPRAAIDEARRSHEFIISRDGIGASDEYRPDTLSRFPLNAPLAEPHSAIHVHTFDRDALSSLRQTVSASVADSGLSYADVQAFVAAVNEIATNSVVHGGGCGEARIWSEPGKVICEIRDSGVIDEPLADRRRPGARPSGARGFWLANQLCDLVQVRSDPAGTTVRIHKLINRRHRSNVVQLRGSPKVGRSETLDSGRNR